MITVRCKCGVELQVAPSFARTMLRWRGVYGFGNHVRDPKAFVMRWLTALHDWIYTGGQITATTVTMTCPQCRPTPELLVDPEDQAK